MDEECNKLLRYPRGSIWKCHISGDELKSGVQCGDRPVVIISNNQGNYTCDSVVIAMITSKSEKARLGINVGFINDFGQENVILCNQLRTVAKADLYQFIGILPNSIMQEVDKSIKLALSVSEDTLDMEAFSSVVDRILEAKVSQIQESTRDISQETVNHIARKLEEIFKTILIPMEKQLKESKQEAIQEQAPILTALVSADNSQETTEDTIEKKYDYKRKPRGFWTVERKAEFMQDYKTLTKEELLDKWGLDNQRIASQVAYMCKRG